MNKDKAKALLFACIALGAFNEMLHIFRDPENIGKWKAKAIASVVTGIFTFFALYFWRRSGK